MILCDAHIVNLSFHYLSIGSLAVLLFLGPVLIWAGGKGAGGKPSSAPPPATNVTSFSIEFIGLGLAFRSASGMNSHGDAVGESDGLNGSGGPYVHLAGSGTFELNRLITTSMLKSPTDLFSRKTNFSETIQRDMAG